MDARVVHNMRKARQIGFQSPTGSIWDRPMVPLHLQVKRPPMHQGAPGFTQPRDNRRIPGRIQPDARNVRKGPFRRYLDGRLDIDGAQFHVQEGLRKSQAGIPLTEHEALAVMAVFPDREYRGISKNDVRLKARLSEREKSLLRKRCAGY